MSMTWLQIASRVRQEVGGAGTGPTSVTGQVGEYGRIVDWCATAYEEIQKLHNEWLFMRGSFTVNTVIGTGSYSASDCSLTDLRDWRKDTIKRYLTATGVSAESAMFFIDYQNWYDTYNTGTQTNSVPLLFTIGNDKSLKIAPKPDAIYTVTGEYQKSVNSFTLSSDTPNFPAEYHMAVVYGAMMKYYVYTGAVLEYAAAKTEFKRIIKEMRRTQLPMTRLGPPLV